MKTILKCICLILPAVMIGPGTLMAQQLSDPTTNIPQPPSTGTVSISYPYLYNQPSNTLYNFVTTQAPDVPTPTWPPAGEAYRQTTAFVDGIGRPLQTVSKKAHASGADIVQPYVYDEAGRERYHYLQYAKSPTASDGKFDAAAFTHFVDFYHLVSATEHPFSLTQYDNSPLDRVTKQLPPGASWVGAGRGVGYEYRSNEAGEVRLWSIGNAGTDLPVSNGYYNAGEISVLTTTDEDGKFSMEYKDKAGRIVLKKSFAFDNHQPPTAHNGYACTYYVYDDMQRLRYVIPPLAIDQRTESGNTWSITTAVATGLCYSYVYDGRGRMVEKKIPGKEVEYYVYDKRDRPVFHQDGNLRQAGGWWSFTFYDILDRPIVTGKGQATGTTRQDFAAVMEDNSTYPSNHWLYYAKNYNLYHDYPSSLNYCDILSYTYYDGYDQTPAFNFDPAQYNGQIPVGSPMYVFPKNATVLRGMVTATKQRVLLPDGLGDYLTTVNYYDDDGRNIQAQSENLNGGLDISSNIYYFQGSIWKNILRHENPQAKPIANSTDGPHTQRKLVTVFERGLERAGGDDQLTKITQQTDNGIEYAVANYYYDHMGRMVTKQTPAGNTLQEYNMRGLLNHIDVANTNNVPDSTHLFEENLYYDQGFGSRLFNGNIAGITWRKAGNNAPVEAYGYSYDMLNRLSHAEYRRQNAANQWSNAAYDYTASGMDYDLNGNLQHMNQRGINPPGINAPIDMDQLSYTYAPASNQLVKVQDLVVPSATVSLPDFKDNANASQEYSYDPNGNMLTDANKQITSPILYNYLNKPAFIQLPAGEIGYVYDISGSLLQKRVKTYSVGTKDRYDYIGNFVYKNDTLQYFRNTEGKSRPVVNSTGETKFVYDYFVKDHLGNVRSTINAAPIDEIYLARHEISLANIEQLIFDNIPTVRDSKPGSNDPEDRMAARLNGSDKRVGTAIMLKTMPGDRFIVKSDAFYEGEFKSNGDSGPEAVVESLMSALLKGNTYAGIPIDELPENVRIVKNALSNPSLIGQLNNLSANDDPDRPRAHLNVLFFDNKLQLVDKSSSVTQVPFDGISGWNTFGPIPEFNGPPEIGVVSPGDGYVLVYVDNQSIGKDVWFDNIMIENYTGKVLEEDHYYPFGLTIQTSQAINAKKNDIKFQSQRHEDDFGLNMYSFKYREHDPQIGRFWQIDPLADKYEFNSTYAFSENKVVNAIELEGLEAVKLSDGNTLYGPWDRSVTTGTDGKTTSLAEATYNMLKKVEINDKGEASVINTIINNYQLKDLGSTTGFINGKHETIAGSTNVGHRYIISTEDYFYSGSVKGGPENMAPAILSLAHEFGHTNQRDHLNDVVTGHNKREFFANYFNILPNDRSVSSKYLFGDRLPKTIKLPENSSIRSIGSWRTKFNEYYRNLNKEDQATFKPLLDKANKEADKWLINLTTNYLKK
ncbi:DUF6443 domain-containing protein [Taibaiella koreensis]|uniref:DUF6443 domain-containing protein n=1 Tax=Taibaiella koreensis TaxID=1268548 RepID=UPI000E59BCDC|nr:DUF6443 domain-containing protein [Taibaiella koreensis]